MWFTFVTARLFHSLSIQPHLTVALLSSCSVANSPTRRVGLSPTLRPASLAQASLPSVESSVERQIFLASERPLVLAVKGTSQWPLDIIRDSLGASLPALSCWP